VVWGFGDEGFELVDEAMDTLGLATEVTREMQGIANDNAGALMAADKAEDGALVAAGLGALDGEERLCDAQGIGERDADAAGADVQAKPGLRRAEP
jgi:hypothetical protein